MTGLLSIVWFFMGVIWAIAGKPFIEVAACFLISGIFEGTWELYLIKHELEDDEE